jgi:fumarylacetoacetate (FAA) hydrolase family protein
MELDHKSREVIEDILNRRQGIQSMQAQLKEDLKALADYLAVKPAQVARIISLVERERAKGDVLAAERDLIDAAESMVPASGGQEG